MSTRSVFLCLCLCFLGPGCSDLCGPDDLDCEREEDEEERRRREREWALPPPPINDAVLTVNNCEDSEVHLYFDGVFFGVQAPQTEVVYFLNPGQYHLSLDVLNDGQGIRHLGTLNLLKHHNFYLKLEEP